MEYKIIAYIALTLLAVYIIVRAMGEIALKKLIRTELDHVVNSEEHKVKGKYQ
jgi:hypothetical protein